MNIQLGNQIFNHKESPKRKIWWILVVSVLVDAETKSDLLKDHWPQRKKMGASHGALAISGKSLVFSGNPKRKIHESSGFALIRVWHLSSDVGRNQVWNQTNHLIPELAKWGY